MEHPIHQVVRDCDFDADSYGPWNRFWDLMTIGVWRHQALTGLYLRLDVVKLALQQELNMPEAMH